MQCVCMSGHNVDAWYQLLVNKQVWYDVKWAPLIGAHLKNWLEFILIKTPPHFSAPHRYIPSVRPLYYDNCVCVYLCVHVLMYSMQVKIRTPPLQSAIFSSTAAVTLAWSLWLQWVFPPHWLLSSFRRPPPSVQVPNKHYRFLHPSSPLHPSNAIMLYVCACGYVCVRFCIYLIITSSMWHRVPIGKS